MVWCGMACTTLTNTNDVPRLLIAFSISLCCTFVTFKVATPSETSISDLQNVLPSTRVRPSADSLLVFPWERTFPGIRAILVSN